MLVCVYVSNVLNIKRELAILHIGNRYTKKKKKKEKYLKQGRERETEEKKNRKANENKCVDEEKHKTDTVEMCALHAAYRRPFFNLQTAKHLTK